MPQPGKYVPMGLKNRNSVGCNGRLINVQIGQ